jgi:uncharacterized protein
MNINLNNNIVESIKKIAKSYYIEKIILFGSRARGDNKATSDIDIAVYPMQQFQNEGHFASDIEDLETLLKIDIIYVNSDTDTRLIENIDKEGVLIYERL